MMLFVRRLSLMLAVVCVTLIAFDLMLQFEPRSRRPAFVALPIYTYLGLAWVFAAVHAACRPRRVSARFLAGS